MKDFNSYLAGLFEGDGHIWIPPTTLRKKANPRFCITSHKKNEEFLKFLQAQMNNSGFIRRKVSDNALVLTVSNKKALHSIAEALLLTCRTPKIKQVIALVDWLNQNLIDQLSPPTLNTTPLTEDRWLSGFLDADASFYIRVTEGLKKARIALSVTLDQRISDRAGSSYEPVMSLIAETFRTRLLVVHKKQGSYFHIHISSLLSLNLLNNYLISFPLISSKHLDCLAWREVLMLMHQQKHYMNITHIKQLKSQMNTRRVSVNWDFLKIGNAV